MGHHTMTYTMSALLLSEDVLAVQEVEGSWALTPA